MVENGRDGYNRRKNKFKDRQHNKERSPQKGQQKTVEKPRFDKQKGTLIDRPQWIPPKLGQNQLPRSECPYCGKPVNDLSSALSDPATGTPIHFDCVLRKLSDRESLQEGESLTYIGGGRFGVIQFPNPQDTDHFVIKRIIQWEDKEKRAPWRRTVADNFSLT
ncbi:hypothetical protein [Gracilinema caldarium]|uniref:Uncharacterized protein n=1 Tax=Gracilinema caldarium (strain ATCC 51460 / DSM 7334 / H1) TaxID=744872 RepID=F8EYR6_GRAC1|nr:hypothetical protein [Gracilinema caldarium]AEJ18643.1 hypothetical protein Spica_0479 [Gracilinema caldarium DSM 7334]